jgi:hypothetical protein
LSRSIAQATTIPLALSVLLILYVFILRRAAMGRADVTIGESTIAHA